AGGSGAPARRAPARRSSPPARRTHLGRRWRRQARDSLLACHASVAARSRRPRWQCGYAVRMQQVVARPLTRAQQARRQRVVDAAMALGLEGGYEAVQMRDVAARADVAMGTVYRYFTSKDHLLAATLVFWVEQLDVQLARQPPKGATAAERVLGVLTGAMRAMSRQPRLVGAVFTSLASPDPAAVLCQQQITALMEGII